MAWQLMGNAHGNVPGALMLLTPPPPANPVPAHTRSWQPAIPNAWKSRAHGVDLDQATGSELCYRGDTRHYNVITQAGGLWSRNFGRAANVGPGAYDPDSHQAGNMGTSRFVSLTRDLRIAKGMGGNTFVYLCRVNVGVDYNQWRGGNAAQAEVMAVQGVALRDILAVRQLAGNQIFFNTDFQQGQMQPAQVLAAIQALGA